MTPKHVMISIPVDPDTARTFEGLTGQPRLKAEVLLRIQLREILEVLTKPARPLTEVMDEIGRTAQANGLTPEELESILNERKTAGRH